MNECLRAEVGEAQGTGIIKRQRKRLAVMDMLTIMIMVTVSGVYTYVTLPHCTVYCMPVIPQ